MSAELTRREFLAAAGVTLLFACSKQIPRALPTSISYAEGGKRSWQLVVSFGPGYFVPLSERTEQFSLPDNSIVLKMTTGTGEERLRPYFDLNTDVTLKGADDTALDVIRTETGIFRPDTTNLLSLYWRDKTIYRVLFNGGQRRFTHLLPYWPKQDANFSTKYSTL